MISSFCEDVPIVLEVQEISEGVPYLCLILHSHKLLVFWNNPNEKVILSIRHKPAGGSLLASGTEDYAVSLERILRAEIL